MKNATDEKLISIWKSAVVGTKNETINDRENIQDLLYKLLISRNSEILKELNIDTNSLNKQGIVTLENIIKIFSKIEHHQLGFFPRGILLTKKLTCAGSAMLINSILHGVGHEVYYLRPAFHSVNVVKVLNDYYWVDGANGVLDKITLNIETKGKFKLAHIESTNPKIPYKVAGLFESRDVIVNIFGNLQALKKREAEDAITVEFLKHNPELYDMDFNYFLESFYTQYFDYIRYDEGYINEKERITKWIEQV